MGLQGLSLQLRTDLQDLATKSPLPQLYVHIYIYIYTHTSIYVYIYVISNSYHIVLMFLEKLGAYSFSICYSL